MLAKTTTNLTEPRTNQTRLPDHLTEVLDSLRELRGSIHDVVTRPELVEAAGRPIVKPADLVRALRIDAKLAGQVFRAIESTSPESFAALLPPLRGLERISKALASAKVEKQARTRFKASLDKAARLMDQQFGDRWAFDAIMSPFLPKDEMQSSTRIGPRRTAFRINAEAYGYSTDNECVTYIVWPNEEDSSRFNLALLRFKEGVRRYQSGLDIPIVAMRARTGIAIDRDPAYIPPPHPIFSPHGSGESDCSSTAQPLIVDAHTTPKGLNFSKRTMSSGITLIELRGDNVANASRCDLAIGAVNERAVPAWAGHDDEGIPTHFRLKTHIRTPMARTTVLLALLDERPTPMTPVFSHTAPLPIDPTDESEEPRLINAPLSLEEHGHLDRPPLGPAHAKASNFINEVIDRLGLAERTLHFWKAEALYPLMYTTIECQLILPEEESD